MRLWLRYGKQVVCYWTVYKNNEIMSKPTFNKMTAQSTDVDLKAYSLLFEVMSWSDQDRFDPAKTKRSKSRGVFNSIREKDRAGVDRSLDRSDHFLERRH